MANPGRVKKAKTVEIPEEIVRAAMAAPELKGRVFLCSTRREALVCDGKVVGFVTPHETASGWRHGPIYVDPEYRGRGLVEAYYAAHPERDCVAFVRDDNPASLSMHTSAGFELWKRAKDGAFYRRPAAKGAGRGRE
jgi:L-amino acid N-acyltransferase YncA